MFTVSLRQLECVNDQFKPRPTKLQLYSFYHLLLRWVKTQRITKKCAYFNPFFPFLERNLCSYLLWCHHQWRPFPPQEPWFLLAEPLVAAGLEGECLWLFQLRRKRQSGSVQSPSNEHNPGYYYRCNLHVSRERIIAIIKLLIRKESHCQNELTESVCIII